MPRSPRSLARFALLPAALALFPACDDPAELAREVVEARGGCTEEKLRAGDEECVRMMGRYAEMGTEAIETYIGAIKALDQALQRRPPAQFDTAGLGHALSPGLRRDDSLEDGLAPAARADAYAPPAEGWHGWGTGPGQGARDGRYDPRQGGAPYPEPYPGSTYPDQGRFPDQRWAPRDADQYPDPYADPYGSAEPDPYWRQSPYSDPRAGDPYGPPAARRSGHWRGGQAPDAERWPDPRRAPPPAFDPSRPPPPERGRLLPPEQRLRRPWLEQDPRMRRYRDAGGAHYDEAHPDTAAWPRPPRYRSRPPGEP